MSAASFFPEVGCSGERGSHVRARVHTINNRSSRSTKTARGTCSQRLLSTPLPPPMVSSLGLLAVRRGSAHDAAQLLKKESGVRLHCHAFIPPLVGMMGQSRVSISRSDVEVCVVRNRHAPQPVREAASRLAQPRKGHTLKHLQQRAHKRPAWNETAYSNCTLQPVHWSTVSSDRCCRAPAAFRTYSSWSWKCPTSVVVKVPRETLEEIALKSVHGTTVGARNALRSAEERARLQREPGCAITTSACLKHSSDRNRFVHLATSASLQHSSHGNLLVHSPQVHIWTTVQTRTVCAPHHKRVSETHCRRQHTCASCQKGKPETPFRRELARACCLKRMA